jgi:two-component system chemotaxis response regulator CheY
MKILVVDDSPTSRLMLIKCLKQLDQKDIVEAENGVQALERLASIPGIRLVLLDRYMPEMDGLQTLEKIKMNDDWTGIKTSMVTSEDDNDEKFRTVADFRADYYIIKPVTTQALVRMFAKLFPGS